MKFIQLFSAALIVFGIFLIMVGLVSSATLDPSTCQNFNYTYFSDETNTSQEANEEICCTDCAAPSEVYTNITILPGEIRTGQNQNCRYDMGCQAQSCGEQTTTMCERDQLLNPGERYRYKDDACDLDFQCTSTQNLSCLENIDTEISIDVMIQDGEIRVSSLNQSKTFASNVSTLSSSFPVSVKCPVVYSGLEVNDTSNIAWNYNNCKTWIEFFDERNFIAYDAALKIIDSNSKDTLNFTQTLMQGQETFRTQLLDCMQKQIDLQKTVVENNNQLTGMSVLKDESSDLKGDRTALLIICGILAFALMGCLIKGINEGWFKNGGEEH